MTVSELILKLQGLKKDQLIMVDGYEGGFCDIQDIEEWDVLLNKNDAPWDGPHDVNWNHGEGSVMTYVIGR